MIGTECYLSPAVAFKEFGGDIFAWVAFWPSVSVAMHTADPYVIKVLTTLCAQYSFSLTSSSCQQIATQHSAFPKPLDFYKPLNFFGPNILATEGKEWRRHRKIVARSFGEANHRLVWEEATKIVLDLFTHWDRQGNGGEIKLPSVVVITREIAVMVIGIAGEDMVSFLIQETLTPPCIGFGIRTSWEDSDFRLGQHRMVCGFPLA